MVQGLESTITTNLLAGDRQGWQKSILLALPLISSITLCSPAAAQIVPDGTLGAESSTVRQDNIKGIPSEVIEGGAARGANLFHSFQEFNVGEGRGAYFANPAAIENILTRVTGSNPSNILGTLGVLGNANLFLINPNGILFGANARLDVRGSFVASTADSLLFDNGFEFSAANPQAPPLLTVNIPIGLRFREKAGSIGVQGSSLEVQLGKTLALVGGDVSLDGGLLLAPGGQVELGGLTGMGIVGLNGDGSLSFPDGIARADVSLTNGAFVNVTAGSGGSIAIDAQDIDVLGGSVLLTGIGAGLGSVGSQAGDITFNATGTTTVANNSFILNYADSGTLGNAGDVTIETGRLSVSDGSQVAALTFGKGDAGNLTVRASEVELIGTSADKRFSSGLFAQTQGTGAAGNITIDTGKLIVRDGAVVSSNTFSEGLGGTLTVIASESVELRGTKADGLLSGLFSGTSDAGTAGDLTITTKRLSVSGDGARVLDSTSGAGDAGNLTIATETLIIQDGGQVLTVTTGKGKAGNVTAIASESVELRGNAPDSRFPTLLGAQVAKEGKGNAGDMTIETGQLTIRDGAQVNNSTFGVGDAGNLMIRASEVEVIGESADGRFDSGIHAQVEIGAEGNAKDILIEAGRLTLRDGGQVSAATFGVGDGGNLTVRASEVELIGTATVGRFPSLLRVQVEPGGKGNSGNLAIETERLSVRNGGQVSAATFGIGNGGNLTVRASEVEVIGTSAFGSPSLLTTAVRRRAIGDAGDLRIETGRLLVRDGGGISTATFGRGNAGNLVIQARDTVSVDGGKGVEAGNFGENNLGVTVEKGAIGNGGDLIIQTGSLLTTNGARLSASTAGEGNSGNIIIRSRDTVSFDESFAFSAVDPGAVGNGGSIDIQTGSLSATNGSRLVAATFGRGDAGNVIVRARDTVSFDGEARSGSIGFTSGAFSNVRSQSIGNGGNVDIQTGSLSVTNGAELAATTFGRGNAGNVRVRAAENVFLSNNSSISTAVEVGAVANRPSNIDIQTRQLSLTDGSQITASTAEEGDAGKITITANTFEATGGSRIQTNTASSGKAGDITLNLRDSLNLNASAIEASTAPESTGQGGNIFIDPNQVNLTDRAKISVNSQGQGNSGSIFLSAENLTLDSGSEISAATASGEGGNIALQISDLLRLRNNSPISATAGGTGNGGNIAINTDFLVANDNSNITANAFQGRGGNIGITAQGIFLTPDSQITASSQLGVEGVVEINTPETEPSRGLVDLPETIVDPNELLAQNACKKGAQSEFTISGRGGLPSTPEQVQTSDEVGVSLVEPAEESAATVTSPSIATAAKEIVPAQGWVRNEKGEVVLVAYNPAKTGIQRQERNLNACPPR
jgi:filamentous hemagglutinin family protein